RRHTRFDCDWSSDVCSSDLLRAATSSIPGVFPTLNPSPVLQINIGATGSQFGRYSYALSGINPEEVYAAADAFGAKLRSYDGFEIGRASCRERVWMSVVCVL